QDLGPVVAVAHRPAGFSLMRGVSSLHRIADIFAVPIANLPDNFTFRVENHAGVSAVGANLLTADVHFGRAVHARHAEAVRAQGFRFPSIGHGGSGGDIGTPGLVIFTI